MFLYLLPSPALLPSLLPPYFFLLSLNFVFSHALFKKLILTATANLHRLSLSTVEMSLHPLEP